MQLPWCAAYSTDLPCNFCPELFFPPSLELKKLTFVVHFEMRGKIMLEILVAHCHPMAWLILAVHVPDRIHEQAPDRIRFCFREYPAGWQSHCLVTAELRAQGFVWHGHGPRLSKTIFIVATYRPRFVLQSIILKGANATQSESRIVQHGSFSVHDVGPWFDVGLRSCFLEICFHKQQIDNCIGMY